MSLSRIMICVSSFGFCSLAGDTIAPAESEVVVSVARASRVESIVDFLRFNIVVLNTTAEEIHMIVPEVGNRTGGTSLIFLPSSGWRARDESNRVPDSPSSGRVTSGLVRFLVVQPGKSGTIPLDLRDYFDQIDLNNPSIGLEISGTATVRAKVDGPNAGGYLFQWKGVISIPVESIKGVDLRI